jgi:hypothetical protein
VRLRSPLAPARHWKQATQAVSRIEEQQSRRIGWRDRNEASKAWILCDVLLDVSQKIAFGPSGAGRSEEGEHHAQNF